MAKQGSLTLRGRFPAGSEVRLVRVDGAHVMRPGPSDETVDSQTVGKDGVLEFSKGVEADGRYFAVGYVNGQPLEVRLRGRAGGDVDTTNTAYDGNELRDRVRLADGSWLDEPPKQHQDSDLPEGATWLAQDQVPRGVLQRSDTPRGAAAVISVEERERATRQWRTQEPTDAVVEETPDPGSEPARTAEPADHSRSATTKSAAKMAAKAKAAAREEKG